MISWIFFYFNVPWISCLWVMVAETILILFIRDGTFLFFKVFLKDETIAQWHTDGMNIARMRACKNLSIYFPPSFFLAIEDFED